MENREFDLNAVIRRVADFPKPGVTFFDITSVLVNAEAFQYCIDAARRLFANERIDSIAGIDARGFVFAAPLAYALKLPLVLARKNDKLPGDTYRRSFDLEYNRDVIEIHKSDIVPKHRMLIVDDLIATGGTARATAEILMEVGCDVAAVFGIIGLGFLDYDSKLRGLRVETLARYDSPDASP